MPAETIFRANVRFLLRLKCLSQREASEQIGVPYKWLRRLCHHGLAQIDRRTKTDLEKLARFFEVPVEDLWRDCIRSDPPANWVLIKWVGSKRRQAKQIVRQFPRRVKTYWEPFIGSGEVLHELLSSDIEVKRIRCSDICEPLIGIWNLVKDDPRQLADRYQAIWEKLQSSEQACYYEIRDRFNQSGDPCDFFFLLRTCRIGFVEFNQKGEFISRYHFGESGMEPKKVNALLADWHHKLQKRDITFTVRDYGTVFSRPGDYLYLDPPYRSQRSRLYYGRFDHEQFFLWLAKQRAGYALSLNGTGDSQYASVPEHLFDQRLELPSGSSPALRLNGMEAPAVTDFLYTRNPAVGSLAVGQAVGPSSEMRR